MSDQRTKIGPRINEETWQQFRDFVHDVHGETRGRIAQELENAIEEYMDHGRTARLEEDHDEILERLDALEATLGGDGGTRTHTARATPRTVSEKVDLIGAQLRDYEHPVFDTDRVEEAIKGVAGGDDRTLEKYRRELKSHGHIYQHPSAGSEAWTSDKHQFVSWVWAHMENVPDARASDLIEPYGMDHQEFERLTDEQANAERQERVAANR